MNRLALGWVLVVLSALAGTEARTHAAGLSPNVIPGPETCCEWTPHWSPDGRRLAFAWTMNPLRSAGVDPPIYQLATVPAKGGTLRLVPGFQGFVERLDWTADGGFFVFAREHAKYDDATGYLYYPSVVATADIFVQRADGRGARRVAAGWAPAWSPEGRRLAFALQGRLYVSDANGRGRRRITARPREILDIAWSPDGRQLAASVAGRGIWLFDLGGRSTPRMVAGTDELSPSEIDWAPDGRKIVIAGSVGAARSIGALELRSGRVRWLTPLSYETVVMDPAWSPDGKRIAFTSDAGDGHQHLFVMNSDGTQRHRVAVHT